MDVDSWDVWKNGKTTSPCQEVTAEYSKMPEASKDCEALEGLRW